MITASDQARVSESFSAFGERPDPTDWAGPVSTVDQARIAETTERGYTFHSNLQDSALIHMNGRVTDAELGRFLSASGCYGGSTPKSVVDVVFDVLIGPFALFLSV